MTCSRCAARDDPARWFKVIERDLKLGISPEWLTCHLCQAVMVKFGSEEFVKRNILFTHWLKVHHRGLPQWLIPAHVAVMLSHGQMVDNYLKHLAFGSV